VCGTDTTPTICAVGHTTGSNAIFPLGYKPEIIAYHPTGYIGP